MSLVKKNIHMNNIRGKIVSQMTLDDDINVPDRFPDIESKITEKGTVMVEQVKGSQNKISVRGKLQFKMIYRAAGNEVRIHRLEGFVPFDEMINMDGIEDGDTISVDLVIDDLSVSVINSRKFSVKAVITVVALAENINDEEFVVDIDDDSIEYIKESIELTQIAVKKKDLLRIREEVNLLNGKMNIEEIIWNTADLTSRHVKLMDDRIGVNGEITVFVLYSSEEGPLQWTNATVPFDGVVEVPGCNEEMIPNIELKLVETEVEAKPDFDGEQRVLALDGTVTVDIKLYEEQRFEIVRDAYSRKKDLELKTRETTYENLLMKNVKKCKVSERLNAGTLGDTHVMQICNCDGEIKIDETKVAEDGIEVEGVLDVSLLYICSDDANPLCSLKESIPFRQKIEINGISDRSVYNIRAVPEQLTANMSGTDEMEVKAGILLDCIVFDQMKQPVLTEIEQKDYDLDQISAMPGIVGYVCKKEDNLWNIAKRFYTTVECLKAVNDIKKDVEEGQMIVVVKKM